MSTLQPERESTNTTSADHHPSTHPEPDNTQPLHSVPSTGAAPAHTPPSTPSSNPETSSTPLNNYNQLVERDSTESNGFTTGSPSINHVDSHSNASSTSNDNQSNISAFNGDTYDHQGTVPLNSLLFTPVDSQAFRLGPQLALNSSSYSLDSHSDNSDNSARRASAIPRISIDTSPSLNDVSAPDHSTSGLGASRHSPPPDYESPYTLASLSRTFGTLVIAGQSPAHNMPHQYSMSPDPESPYQIHQARPPSPTTSIRTFDDLNLVSHVGYPQPVDHTAPHTALQPVQSVYEIARMYPGASQLVPQRTYRPNTQSDRRRYVEEVQLEQPIMFFVTGPGSLGISCRDALNSRFLCLRDRDDQMFINRGPSVSIRLQWPGYPAWSRQIPTRDFRNPPGPITRAKLAKNVAKTVDRFINEMSTKSMEDEANPMWRVGHGHITVDSLELVGLQHVSMGGWQVHLRWRGNA